MRLMLVQALLVFATLGTSALVPVRAQDAQGAPCHYDPPALGPNRLSCKDAPLTTFLEYVNARNEWQVVAPAALEGWNCDISGVFRTNDLDDTLDTLKRRYALDSTRVAMTKQVQLAVTDQCFQPTWTEGECVVGYEPNLGPHVKCVGVPLQQIVDLFNQRNEWQLSLPADAAGIDNFECSLPLKADQFAGTLARIYDWRISRSEALKMIYLRSE